MATKMGIEIYTHDLDGQHEQFILVCNTSDAAFSRTLYGTKEQAREFINWLPNDARQYSMEELEAFFSVFCKADAVGVKIKVVEE